MNYYCIVLFTAVALFAKTSAKIDCGDKFSCVDGLGCVSSSQLCDSEPQCQDWSDELHFKFCKEMQNQRRSCAQGQVFCNRPKYGGYRGECMDIARVCREYYQYCMDNPASLCGAIYSMRIHLAPKDREVEEFRAIMKYFAKTLNKTRPSSRSQCPTFYKPYFDKCIADFRGVKLPWHTAKLFCESTSGQFAVLSSIKDFQYILLFLKTNGPRERFWIGGQYQEQTSDASPWKWTDGSSVDMGSIFWSVTLHRDERGACYENNRKKMRPFENHGTGYCLAMLEENFYYYSEEPCTNEYSPLCFAERVQKIKIRT